MQLTQKLLSFISRVFDKDPRPFLALRLSYAGGMTWRIEENVLTTQVSGGVGGNLTVDLGQHTVSSLVFYLAGQPGYSVLYSDPSDQSRLSARVLIDAEKDIATSNGDHIYGYSNVVWAFFDAVSNELNQAKTALSEMLKQMSTKTASETWLDELGDHYGVPRLDGETDAQYGPRIIAEVLRPRSNNVALEMAIKTFTGQDAKVSDVVLWTAAIPAHDSTITHDGANTYSSSAHPLYGLFDVQYGYDLLNGGDFTEFQQVVRDLVDRLRAAGTHLRSLMLTGSAIGDSFTAPTDSSDPKLLNADLTLADTLTTLPTDASAIAVAMGDFSDTADAAADAAAVSIQYAVTYSGLRSYNGKVEHRGTDLVPEAL